MDISSIRKDYKLKQLDKIDVHADPFVQFKAWFAEAIAAQVNEPNAMNLATVKASGKPSSRIVLLKGIEEQGLVFYTNYQSHKGQELQAHPFGSLCFFWPELERQVRIEGDIKKVAPPVSDAYFQSRPYESQLGAWVSPQSQVIETRAVLEQKYDVLKNQYAQSVPRPAHWGGYVLLPNVVEFWQGRENRLHDRMLYELRDGDWQLNRLAP
jgi:pyridoxamine 5'-phosphate oxidase